MAAGDGFEQAGCIVETGSGDDLAYKVLGLRCRVLDAADTKVAFRHADHDAAGYGAVLADHLFAGGKYCEGTCRRYADGVHERRDEVFAQHRADRTDAVRSTP